jgi:hypothetical protein
MTDTERLDWLEKHDCWIDCADFRSTDPNQRYFIIIHPRPGQPHGILVCNWSGPSIRAVVDLAAANYPPTQSSQAEPATLWDALQKIREGQTKTLEQLATLSERV